MVLTILQALYFVARSSVVPGVLAWCLLAVDGNHY